MRSSPMPPIGRPRSGAVGIRLDGTTATSISADAFARRSSSGRPRPARLERFLTRSLGPSSIPSLGDGVMLGTAWIDRPVDTQDLHSLLPRPSSAAWKCSHAQAVRIPVDSCVRAARSGCRSAASAVSETRKLAAILVSDVVGYSRLTGADEDRILARLRALRSDLIDPTIAVHHGRIVKRTGDGSIVEFRSVVDAVNCAIEVQRAMVERNAEVAPDKRIEFRIGIHLGDVVEESDGDLMGDGVNIAARLQGVAKPGGICISDDAYRQVKGRLDLKVSDLGPVPLKNIAEPMRAYSLEVGAPREARSPPPADQAKPAPKRRSSFASLAAAIAALLLLAVAGGWYILNGRAPKPVEAAHLSIVVLPFANLSGDPEQDYFADGITDDLTTDLSHLPDSFVIARGTAFTYKGKPLDAKQIGRELGVRYVLEGSVRRVGENDHGQRPAHLDRDRRACLGRPVRRRTQQARPVAGGVRLPPRQFARRGARQGRGSARDARAAEQSRRGRSFHAWMGGAVSRLDLQDKRRRRHRSFRARARHRPPPCPGDGRPRVDFGQSGGISP